MKKKFVDRVKWGYLLIAFAVILIISGILCAFFPKTPINTAFSIIGGISFVGVIVTGLMFWRSKAVIKKDKNFTCKKCGKKFVWDESKIQCNLISVETNVRGSDTFRHYRISVKWQCECGEVNAFEITLSSRNEVIASMVNLVSEYYKGNIVN